MRARRGYVEAHAFKTETRGTIGVGYTPQHVWRYPWTAGAPVRTIGAAGGGGGGYDVIIFASVLRPLERLALRLTQWTNMDERVHEFAVLLSPVAKPANPHGCGIENKTHQTLRPVTNEGSSPAQAALNG